MMPEAAAFRPIAHRTVDIYTRPPKIATLLYVEKENGKINKPADWMDVCLEIISYYSVLWGGWRNIIVPVELKDYKAITSSEVFQETLKEFDPDIIVLCPGFPTETIDKFENLLVIENPYFTNPFSMRRKGEHPFLSWLEFRERVIPPSVKALKDNGEIDPRDDTGDFLTLDRMSVPGDFKCWKGWKGHLEAQKWKELQIASKLGSLHRILKLNIDELKSNDKQIKFVKNFINKNFTGRLEEKTTAGSPLWADRVTTEEINCTRRPKDLLYPFEYGMKGFILSKMIEDKFKNKAMKIKEEEQDLIDFLIDYNKERKVRKDIENNAGNNGELEFPDVRAEVIGRSNFLEAFHGEMGMSVLPFIKARTASDTGYYDQIIEYRIGGFVLPSRRELNSIWLNVKDSPAGAEKDKKKNAEVASSRVSKKGFAVCLCRESRPDFQKGVSFRMPDMLEILNKLIENLKLKFTCTIVKNYTVTDGVPFRAPDVLEILNKLIEDSKLKFAYSIVGKYTNNTIDKVKDKYEFLTIFDEMNPLFRAVHYNLRKDSKGAKRYGMDPERSHEDNYYYFHNDFNRIMELFFYEWLMFLKSKNIIEIKPRNGKPRNGKETKFNDRQCSIKNNTTIKDKFGFVPEQLQEDISGKILEGINPSPSKNPESLYNYFIKKDEKDENKSKDKLEGKLQGSVDKLVLKGLIERGILLTCNNCSFTGWYHLNEVGEFFKCKQCMKEQIHYEEGKHYKYMHKMQKGTFPVHYRLYPPLAQGFGNGLRPILQVLNEINLKKHDKIIIDNQKNLNNEEKENKTSFLFEVGVQVESNDNISRIEFDAVVIRDGKIFLIESKGKGSDFHNTKFPFLCEKKCSNEDCAELIGLIKKMEGKNGEPKENKEKNKEKTKITKEVMESLGCDKYYLVRPCHWEYPIMLLRQIPMDEIIKHIKNKNGEVNKHGVDSRKATIGRAGG